MTLWRADLTCGKCGAEIKVERHVPEARKGWISLMAPFSGVCPTDSLHSNSTGKGFNVAVEVQWSQEERQYD